MEQGIFLFTLDTEFAWGHYDIYDPRIFSGDGSRERHTVARILDMLDEYQLTATWAVVGRLFCKDHAACLKYTPPDGYRNYPQFDALFRNDHPLLYAPDLITLLTTRGARHEIGFHGFSHRTFPQMTEAEARAEIETWLAVAAPYGLRPKTLVFPQNLIAYLGIFKEYGFSCFRGEEAYPGCFASPSILGKALRRFYPFTSLAATPVVSDPQMDASGLLNFPSSYSLFTIDRFIRRMNLQGTSINVVIRGIKQAVIEKKIFHLYAHPFEFREEGDFSMLRRIFQAVKLEIDRGRMLSCSSGSLANSILRGEGV